MFVRRESFPEFRRSYPIVTGLIALNGLLFLTLRLPGIGDLIFGLGVGHNMAIAAGEIWRLLSPIFLHYEPLHFLFNLFGLLIFAPPLERMLGPWKFTGLYLISGLAGNGATFLLGPDNYVHLGASGALYGLLGLYLYLVLFHKALIDPASRQIVITILIIGLIYTLLMPRVNLYAHLFGFLAGFSFGPICFMEKKK